MNARQISEREEVKNGDRIRMMFGVLNIAERFIGWAFPQWGRERWEERMQEARRNILARQAEHGGFTVLDFRPVYDDNALIVDVRITDSTRFSRGLSGVPVVAVWAVAYVIISITAALGINMALMRVEKIVERPAGAAAFVAISIATVYILSRMRKR